ncbi:MAG: hypothetical protein HRU21_10010 [Pseudomonadales bacterium]|nr:hypothetical protein [Pseudomonadales bacterium]
MHSSNHLFFVSTPLHLLVSIAIIDTENIQQAALIFIDQVPEKDNIYAEILDNWEQSPFCSIQIFYRSMRGNINKFLQRKKIFKQLANFIESYRPSHIYVGNDRRIEFQYAMQLATVKGLAPHGYYLDEGTFTYVGRSASFRFSDRWLDNGLKKLSYGWWWKHPATVGASAWIKTIYASYPDQIHPLLATKNVRHLNQQYWSASRLKTFCQLLLDRYAANIDFSNFDLIMTLPHESIMQSNPSYAQQCRDYLSTKISQGLRIAVKYHPRDQHIDGLQLAKLETVTILPALIPFEAMLPMLKPSVTIVGDVSTALITAKLLRADAQVQAILAADATLPKEFAKLYQQIGVKCIEAAVA